MCCVVPATCFKTLNNHHRTAKISKFLTLGFWPINLKTLLQLIVFTFHTFEALNPKIITNSQHLVSQQLTSLTAHGVRYDKARQKLFKTRQRQCGWMILQNWMETRTLFYIMFSWLQVLVNELQNNLLAIKNLLSNRRWLKTLESEINQHEGNRTLFCFKFERKQNWLNKNQS